MFSFKYEPRYGDYKDCNNIKISSILDMVQDVSTRASASIGYDVNTLKDMGIAWLLQGVNLKIEKPIRPDLPIEISTAIKPSNGVTSERFCIITQNDEVVAKTVSNWFVFNVNRQKPTRIPKEMLAKYEVIDTEDDFFNYDKVEIFDVSDIKYSITVSNKDIDTNMHLNNQKSAELLMDALPFDYYFNEMNILYKKPAFLGDKLDLCITEITDGYYVQLQAEGNEMYVAGTFRYTK